MSEMDRQAPPPTAGKPARPVRDRPWWRTPFQYMLRIRPRQRQLRGSLVHRLLGSRLFEPALWVPGRESLALGVAIGTFFGMLPVIGLQILLSAVFCYFMRANIAAAAFATLVSNPFTAPGLIWMQLKLGHWLAPAFAAVDDVHYEGTAKFLATYGKPLLVGSLASATFAALLAYPVILALWSRGERIVRRHKALRAARLQAAREASLRAHAPADGLPDPPGAP